ncbi:MAG: hypothetical protein Q8K65_08595 [Alphaproteobacteria bacterium]|nr:hypothetical protein [Alphaproteobacteria bacterium]
METSPHEINTLQVCTKVGAIAIFYPLSLCGAANPAFKNTGGGAPADAL